MASSSKSAPADHRRKWDRDEYEQLAASRLAEEEAKLAAADEKGPPVQRELLRQREYKVDLDSRLGKSVVITKSTPAAQSGGYYCNVCDCVVKDSINFLDHINGKKHQRNLGMSMRVERSSLEQVRERFNLNKRKREEQRKEYDMEERLAEIREEEEKQKEYRREKRQEKKKRRTAEPVDDVPGLDPALAAMMGFSGFGGTKQ